MTKEQVFEFIKETYKKRMQIEQSFDVLKSLLEQDHCYMQSDTAFAAWTFLNHISLMLCYRLYDQLQKSDILKKYSAKDVLYYLRDIRALRIHGIWQFAEVTKKSRSLLHDLDSMWLIENFVG